MRVFSVVAVLCCLLVGFAGCGSDADSEAEQEARQTRIAEERQEQRRARERAEARKRRQVRQREQAEQRQAQAEQREQEQREERQQEEAEERARQEEEEAGPEPETVECHPSYEGACLDPTASDYDCEGGSGDGPLYTGPVTVVGSDEYGLDSDGDGSACEAS